MAVATVTEYEDGARVFAGSGAGGGSMQCGQEPAVAVQDVTFGAAAVSAAFSGRTRLVRIWSNADCRVVFGAAPVAAAGSTPLTAKSAEYFGVQPGQKVSIWDGVS